MPGIRNVADRGVSAARNVFKYSSGTLRSLMGHFTESAMILIFAAALGVAFYQQHTNVALSALAAALAVTAFTTNVVLGLAAGLVVFGVDLFLRVREPFANPKKEVEAKDDTEGETEPEAPVEGLSNKKRPPPDHGDRAEFLELGKKYKLPSESDDKDFHLDAGSTFLNAYKSLKPDQLAAMTKDTQDLMQTQKQLMSTLQTLKPLIMDGKEMMNTFQSYFGAGGPPA
jgi:hypothetical protein